ncbi:hydroxylamine reductase [Haloplasma contractile]|uniref:Hydroxylamine reductase n=1 Tax=Haloplasma contractile SSD-17B TaxID=1033810 RepID=F7PWJ9_9MOLU|nr:hydroxylamine reductase [Haloplasma contractile]ERJ12634.1 Hydroxylamine reductase 1 protein [Haloplasma contractile SSD-17B]
MSMFCDQCQEAAKNVGCEIQGVCGKSPELSALMDTFIYTLKGISKVTLQAKELEIDTNEADLFVTEGLFKTITNANFDDDVFEAEIVKAFDLRDELKRQVEEKGAKVSKDDAINFRLETREDMIKKSIKVGILSTKDEDIRSLRGLIVYGLKGLAAYLSHAEKLGYSDNELFIDMHKALAATNEDLSLDEYVKITFDVGNAGVKGMEILDRANTTSYGNPEMTKVKTGVRNNPAILISGHDLHDIKELLEQTKGTGVDVYTHSEMLPAHYYPELKKYEHLVGNYGNAWHKQTTEFVTFNGPILFTTNCIVPPKKSYIDRVYTTGNVGYPGLIHVPDSEDGKKDFSAIIEHAKRCDAPTAIEDGEIIGGFAHNQVMQLADKVLEAINNGSIKKFVVMSGCDGRHKTRDYYTDFANELPQDSVILTSGCAKYKYNKLDLGDIGGIPRVLDAGQCNDSYSLAVIAMKLQEALGLEDINDLPIVYNIAWYEQKAIIVLLALLALGVKDIKVGPTLPAFLSENVGKLLVEQFGLSSINDVQTDMEELILN